MKLALLHLSDIHFENKNDWIVNKANSIAGSCKSSLFNETVDAFFIVVSGDVANKGNGEQYKIAQKFFEEIVSQVKRERNIPVHIIFVPGNHDCDLSDKDNLELRDNAIESILRDQENVKLRGQIYKECLKVQKDFFSFIHNIEPDLSYPTEPEIFYRLAFDINGKKIIFNCFNTAWLTQIKEKQGQLTMPRQLFPECENPNEDADLSVSIYHHPENWLSADRAGDFTSLLHNCSDIIITGHEHRRNVSALRQIETDTHVQIHRAGALQERSAPEDSNFNVVLLDLDNSLQKITNYHWAETIYKPEKEADWIPFTKNDHLSNKFTLDRDFEKALRSLETVPIYAQGLNLLIEDFFITPRLQVYSYENIIDGKPGRLSVESEDFLKFILDKKKLVIFGETLQGKTITARYLFLKLKSLGLVPVLVDGESVTEKTISRSVTKSVRDQYKGDMLEHFRAMGKEGRVLLIDNFGQGGSNQSQLHSLLNTVENDYEYVIAFGHTNLRIQQEIKNENGDIKISDYAHCELKPFNRAQRYKLLKTWIQKTAQSKPDDEILQLIKQYEQTVESACSSGIIAPYPAYILGVLALSQNFSNPDPAKYGTLGYLYESLITSRFSIFEDSDVDLQQVYILLEEIAFRCYKNSSLDISLEETRSIFSEYDSEYLQSVDQGKFINQATETGIMLRHNGRLEFSSVQIRDFFVAGYYSRALSDDAKKENAHSDIDHIIKTLTFESHTRILLFLVFKAADKPRFIDQILTVSKQIFTEFLPTDLDKDVSFLNEIRSDSIPKPKLLEGGTVWDRREKANGGYDDCEDESPSPYNDQERFLVEYKEDLDEFIKAAIALKMIEVLGQLARSFASALKGATKLGIIEETIELGFRFLKGLYSFQEDELDQMRLILTELIKSRHEELTSTEVLNRADRLVLFGYLGVTLGVISKISGSIGHKDLIGSFDKFFGTREKSIANRIMEAAFRLEHYNDPLIEKITDLGDELKNKNNFMRDVLSQLVVQYLNLNSVIDSKGRQKLIEKFNIKDNAVLLANPDAAARKFIPKQRDKFLPPAKVSKTKRK